MNNESIKTKDKMEQLIPTCLWEHGKEGKSMRTVIEAAKPGPKPLTTPLQYVGGMLPGDSEPERSWSWEHQEPTDKGKAPD